LSRVLKPAYGLALVTGATGGLGRELALCLARAGWGLILVGRDEGRLEACLQSLEGQCSSEAITLRSDLSTPGAVAMLFDECHRRGLEVELLVNNAGAGLFGKSVTLSPSSVESMLSLNIIALTSLCSLFGASMRERGSGRILNIGSLVGKFAVPYFASYAASKSYVLNYSLALRAELGKSGVSVSCLLPGFIRTDFDERAGIMSPRYRRFSERNGLDASRVAEAGLDTLRRGLPYAAIGARNKVISGLSMFVPRSLAPIAIKPFMDMFTDG
jgi:uncharacterized protein